MTFLSDFTSSLTHLRPNKILPHLGNWPILGALMDLFLWSRFEPAFPRSTVEDDTEVDGDDGVLEAEVPLLSEPEKQREQGGIKRGPVCFWHNAKSEMRMIFG